MKLENKYIVLKIKDVQCYLNLKSKNNLTTIIDSIIAGRDYEQRNQLKCVVIEHDWPEYNKVIKILSNRVDNEV